LFYLYKTRYILLKICNTVADFDYEPKTGVLNLVGAFARDITGCRINRREKFPTRRISPGRMAAIVLHPRTASPAPAPSITGCAMPLRG